MLRCIKLWDKFVFDRSTRDVEKRHYDVKGNIVEKNDFGQRGGGRGQTKSDDVNVDDDAEYQVSSRTPIDKRPEMKVNILIVISHYIRSFFVMFIPLLLLAHSSGWTSWNWYRKLCIQICRCTV